MASEYGIPAGFPDHLKIGTCSWKYDSWKGLIYDAERPYDPHDYLRDHAKHFTTIEIDQWLWNLFGGGAKLPNPADVQAYANSVPDDFRFNLKAPNAVTLTHFFAKDRQHANEPNPYLLSVGLLNRFLETLEPMHGKLKERTGGVGNEIVEPKDEGLKATAEIIRQNEEVDIDAVVNVNNHYEGCAPLTIQRLLGVLRQHLSP